MEFSEYQKTLPLARKIYTRLYGKPKSYFEWTNSFNKIKDIAELIIEFKSKN